MLSEDAGSALHPTLVALSIVLELEEDFSRINRSHPTREIHQFYKADAEFPENIADLLPEPSNRWWEHLGKL